MAGAVLSVVASMVWYKVGGTPYQWLIVVCAAKTGLPLFERRPSNSHQDTVYGMKCQEDMLCLWNETSNAMAHH